MRTLKATTSWPLPRKSMMTWPYQTLPLSTMSYHLPLRYLHLPHPHLLLLLLPLLPVAKVRLRPGPSPNSCLPTLHSRRGPRSNSKILHYFRFRRPAVRSQQRAKSGEKSKISPSPVHVSRGVKFIMKIGVGKCPNVCENWGPQM